MLARDDVLPATEADSAPAAAEGAAHTTGTSWVRLIDTRGVHQLTELLHQAAEHVAAEAAKQIEVLRDQQAVLMKMAEQEADRG